MKCEIVENYIDYAPPVPAAKIVSDLLACQNPKHIEGLSCIVLTNVGGQSRKERRRTTVSRKKKATLSESRGFYRHGTRDSQPFIQLNLDRIFRNPDRKSNWLADPIILRFNLGSVLYHEIGHHIHAAQKPENGEVERIADKYMFRLMTRMMRRRWYLMPLFFLGILPVMVRYMFRPTPLPND